MARCQCAGSSCNCAIVAGPGVTVTGVGSANQPYEIGVVAYSYVVTQNASTYQIGAPNQTPIGSRATFIIDPTAPMTVLLPDGSVEAPYPPVGTELDVYVQTTSAVNFGGAIIAWYGPAGATSQGWYRFVFRGDESLGQWTGAQTPPRF